MQKELFQKDVSESFNVFYEMSGAYFDSSALAFGSYPGSSARFSGKLLYMLPQINFEASNAFSLPSSRPSAMPFISQVPILPEDLLKFQVKDQISTSCDSPNSKPLSRSQVVYCTLLK